MKELQKELEQAYELLSAVSVRGDAVEVMAGAKEHLRRAYSLTKGEESDG